MCNIFNFVVYYTSPNVIHFTAFLYSYDDKKVYDILITKNEVNIYKQKLSYYESFSFNNNN